MKHHKILALLFLIVIFFTGVAFASMLNFQSICKYNDFYLSDQEKDIQYLAVDAYREIVSLTPVPDDQKETIYNIYVILMDGDSVDGEVKERIFNHTLSIDYFTYTKMKEVTNKYREKIIPMEREYEDRVIRYNKYIKKFPNNAFNKIYKFREKRSDVYYFKYADMMETKYRLS